MSWKLLKDYLEHSGVVLTTITPSAVIKAAYEANIIDNAETWLKALDARNKLSHTYNFETFSKIIALIESYYLMILDVLHEDMLRRVVEESVDNV